MCGPLRLSLTADELVDLVDGDDMVVGNATLGECLSKGLLHRAVAVMVVRPGGALLLQKRSMKDRWQPGRMTLSSTGHVRMGETYEDAARRELFEELGISAEVNFLAKMLVPPISEDGLTEKEWVCLFQAESASPCRIDPVELDSVAELTLSEVKGLLGSPTLTADAQILLKEYLRSSA